jgi:protein associated with RNAse G/E
MSQELLKSILWLNINCKLRIETGMYLANISTRITNDSCVINHVMFGLDLGLSISQIGRISSSRRFWPYCSTPTYSGAYAICLYG